MPVELNPDIVIPLPKPPSEVDRLRARIDDLVANVGDDFPIEMVARALLVKGTDMMLADSGMMQSIWSVQRIVDLLAGRYTKETADLLIATRNC